MANFQLLVLARFTPLPHLHWFADQGLHHRSLKQRCQSLMSVFEGSCARFWHQDLELDVGILEFSNGCIYEAGWLCHLHMMSCSFNFGQGQMKEMVAHGKGLLHYPNGRLLSFPSIQVAFPFLLS